MDIINIEEFQDLNNKLFCTFGDISEIDSILVEITNKYTILYNKIFILKSSNSDELIFTYNLEIGNIEDILPNTILTHRKKETNTLYTINALNCLIKSLNNGFLNKNYQISWENYNNCILLTQNNELKQINTSIHKIIYL